MADQETVYVYNGEFYHGTENAPKELIDSLRRRGLIDAPIEVDDAPSQPDVTATIDPLTVPDDADDSTTEDAPPRRTRKAA